MSIGMNIGVQEVRPPYVRFERREEEDRTKSIAAGHFVTKEVDYALITPQGSKDCVERNAVEWLAHIAEQAAQERFNPQWVDAFKHKYKLFQEGQEIPLDGTSIREWPIVGKSLAKRLCDLNVRTVEDLAAANDQTLRAIGMGSQDLKQKAMDWLAKAKDGGKIIEELAGIRAELLGLKTRNETLEAQNAELRAQVQALGGAVKGGAVKTTVADAEPEESLVK